MSRRWEQIGPYVLSATLTVELAVWSCIGTALPRSESYLQTMLTLGGVFAGFLATLQPMIFGLSDKTFLRLKKSGYLEDLLKYLREAVAASLVLCLLCLLAFGFVAQSAPLWFGLDALVIGCGVFAALAVERVAGIVLRLLEASRSNG